MQASQMWVSAPTLHTYLLHILKLRNNDKYDTLTNVTLLLAKIIHLTQLNTINKREFFVV